MNGTAVGTARCIANTTMISMDFGEIIKSFKKARFMGNDVRAAAVLLAFETRAKPS